MIAGGVACATIPGSDGTIQGCYLKAAGTTGFRVYATADACHDPAMLTRVGG